MFLQISEVSVLVSAVLAVAVGSVWFSPLLFGTLERGTWSVPTVNQKQFVIRTIGEVLVFVVFYGVLAQSVQLAYEKVPVLEIAFLLTLLISVYTVLQSIQEERPFSFVAIRTGYTAVILFGGLCVMFYWPW